MQKLNCKLLYKQEKTCYSDRRNNRATPGKDSEMIRMYKSFYAEYSEQFERRLPLGLRDPLARPYKTGLIVRPAYQ